MHQYGLIGKSLTHSFSPSYFAQKFEREHLPHARYDAFPLTTIEDFPALLQRLPNLAGLNVTIPYKESILPYLEELSEEAEVIGAVNTIAFEAGRLVGYNTDVVGFRESLKRLLPKEQTSIQALILGTGGAAKAVAYVLDLMNISYVFVSRKEGNNHLLYEQVTPQVGAGYRLWINTTPVGQYPKTDQAPNLSYGTVGPQHFLMDLIYNPSETLFLKRGRLQGAQILNGLPMLEAQAEAAWRIWTSY